MSNLFKLILNNLAPPAVCLLCGTDSEHQAMCAGCMTHLPWLPTNHCPQCAIPTIDACMCGQCLKNPPVFSRTYATFLYLNELTQLIPAAKFGAHWSLLPALAQLMLPTLANAARPDLIIPLPLHPARLKERGFNQALEIAQPLAKTLKLPLENQLLQRIRDTEHQVHLTEKSRHQNMHRAFGTCTRLDGAHVAIVDDVMTTGASLNAAAHALKKAGATQVDCWILARTP